MFCTICIHSSQHHPSCSYSKLRNTQSLGRCAHKRIAHLTPSPIGEIGFWSLGDPDFNFNPTWVAEAKFLHLQVSSSLRRDVNIYLTRCRRKVPSTMTDTRWAHELLSCLSSTFKQLWSEIQMCLSIENMGTCCNT